MLKVANSVISASRITGTLPVANGGTGVTTSTGTTNVVLSNSPTLTTPTIAGATLSGTVSGGGNQINNVVIGTTTPLAGSFTSLTASTTLGVTGATTLSSTLAVVNNVTIYDATLNTPRVLTFSANRTSAGNYGSIIFGNTQNLNNNASIVGSVDANIDDGKLTFSTAPTGGSITERMRISSTGIVTMSAYGAGTATFSAAGVISSVSDETWKIKDGIPTDPDTMLKKLEPGYWYYNDEKKETFGADRQLGFYAQNVNVAIGPEAAPTPEEGKPWGYYDRSILAITVMSLQKALATIESLTARITILENR